MAKAPLYGPNKGFSMWKTPTGARLRVGELGRDVAGPGFSSPNFTFRFARESELPDVMAQRISVTASKFMFAVAQLYVEGGLFAPVTVEGAQVQHGKGNSSRITGPDGKVYLTGTEAAHFGVGTVTRMGEALSVQAARQVQIWRATSGLPLGDPRAEYAASGLLAGYGLAHDASTYLAPAFVNQAEGKQEGIKQPFMTGLLPLFIPAGPGSLELSLNAVGARVAVFLAGDPAAVIRPLNDRLDLLSRGSSRAKEFVQHPSDAENLLFGGSERNLLEAMRDAIRGADSAFQEKVGKLVNNVPIWAEDLAQSAESAREERSAASSPGSDSSGAASAGAGSTDVGGSGSGSGSGE